jgi:hypothetical protein
MSQRDNSAKDQMKIELPGLLSSQNNFQLNSQSSQKNSSNKFTQNLALIKGMLNYLFNENRRKYN